MIDNINQDETIAYIINNSKISYKQLINQSKKIADSFDKTKNPIILLGDKEIDMYICIIACLMAKRTYIPVHITTPKERLEKIIEESNASLLIELSNGIEIKELKYKYIQEKNDIAYIIFTSGSTGIPKGVPISYSNLDNFIEWVTHIDGFKDYKENENIKVLNTANFNFDLSVVDIYLSLKKHYTLVALDKDIKEDVVKMINYIIKEKINIIVSTPSFFKLCLIDEDMKEEKLNSLKTIYFCVELLDINLVKRIKDRFPNVNIINAYGPTEATSAISSYLVKELEEPIPIGDISKSAVKISIEDDEIVLNGKSVFNGYLNKDENNNNIYKTGDLGYIKDGLLYYKGRKDNQIKYNGYRIEIEDIEQNINTIKGIENCIVIPIYKNDKVLYLKALVVTKENIDIKEELKNKIPLYMIPKKIEIVSTLPLNNNGKVDRKRIINDRC